MQHNNVLVYVNKRAKNDLLYADSLTGDQFETYMTYILNHVGFHHVIHTPYSNDHGADAVSHTDSISWQFKNYKHKVPFHAVEEVMFSARYYHTNKNVVLTNNYFSTNTIKTVKKMNESNPQKPIILIDRDKLRQIFIKYESNKSNITKIFKKQQIINKSNLLSKAYKYYRYIEHGIDKSKQTYNFHNRTKQFAYYILKNYDIPHNSLWKILYKYDQGRSFNNKIGNINNSKTFKGNNWSFGHDINNNLPYGSQIDKSYSALIVPFPYIVNNKRYLTYYVIFIYYTPDIIKSYGFNGYPYQSIDIPLPQLNRALDKTYKGRLLNRFIFYSNLMFNSALDMHDKSTNDSLKVSYNQYKAPMYVSTSNSNFWFCDARTLYLDGIEKSRMEKASVNKNQYTNTNDINCKLRYLSHESVVKICPKCHHKIRKHAKYCAFCGYRFINKFDTNVINYKICPRCGTKASNNTKYCMQCGYKFK